MDRLETDRLALREFTADDATFLLALMNSPGWLQFIGDRGVRTVDDAKNYIAARLISSYRALGFGLYAVTLKKDAAIIGMCGLVKRETLEDVDIGFALLPEHGGKGYAAEAAFTVVHYARTQLKLKRLVAITTVDNTSSIKLLEAIGLKFEKMTQSEKGETLKLFSINLE